MLYQSSRARPTQRIPTKILLSRDETTFGRGNQCSVLLQSRTPAHAVGLSRTQAKIIRVPTDASGAEGEGEKREGAESGANWRWVLHDGDGQQKSTNGNRVNSVQVEGHVELSPGDEVQFGPSEEFIYEFLLEEPERNKKRPMEGSRVPPPHSAPAFADRQTGAEAKRRRRGDGNVDEDEEGDSRMNGEGGEGEGVRPRQPCAHSAPAVRRERPPSRHADDQDAEEDQRPERKEGEEEDPAGAQKMESELRVLREHQALLEEELKRARDEIARVRAGAAAEAAGGSMAEGGGGMSQASGGANAEQTSGGGQPLLQTSASVVEIVDVEEENSNASWNGEVAAGAGGAASSSSVVAPSQQPALDWAEEVRNELFCCICQDWIVDCAALDCGHAFCTFCVEEWLEEKHFHCPQCRQAVEREPVKCKNVDSLIERTLDLPGNEEKKEELKKKREEIAEKINKKEQGYANLLHHVEKARRAKTKMLNIQDTWDSSKKRKFEDGVKNRKGAARALYCELVELTRDNVIGTDLKKVDKMLKNLDLWQACSKLTPAAKRNRLLLYIRYG
uniref:E3 ubiquitin-protein ligase CHFR n=1 Tax=Chromera velia CCMP2878 TaxID=1169474 RepID=A0A0G4G9F5_9ALVE|eukprot:Cvel_20849.t1-p1 / transcript=Cvel_20849.t1 / gene=Cvel_20849 / organism=Chromera_velia_CCMP2878 / gene_product=E3 ubiquitin-protein ligase RNF8, putative / transcript_product=E3 ubiquitin-protein ligase RNF8, putative / location=Cvel_scaffold1909:31211-35797(+) / protein_length=560 / sequence_SO=supercontig / SO=protein_coding / is_pseudo=false